MDIRYRALGWVEFNSLSFVRIGRGPGMDLAPLSDVYPSVNRPSTAPLSAAVLAAAFTLEPGTCALHPVRFLDTCLTYDDRALSPDGHART